MRELSAEEKKAYYVGWDRGFDRGFREGALIMVGQMEDDAAHYRSVAENWKGTRKATAKPAAAARLIFSPEELKGQEHRLREIFKKAIPDRITTPATAED